MVDFGHLSPCLGHGNPGNVEVATLAVPKKNLSVPLGLPPCVFEVRIAKSTLFTFVPVWELGTHPTELA